MERIIIHTILCCLSFVSFSQTMYDGGGIDMTIYSSISGGNIAKKWGHSNISYFFENTSSDLSVTQAKKSIKKAFDIWAFYTPLSFYEKNSAQSADIVIKWGTGYHGDNYPFDGVNGVLAHAFYPPPNGGSIAGDIHFDEDEKWTNQVTKSSLQPLDLVTVAAHEIGHSLGIGHSSDSNALMYPYYLKSLRFLHKNDFSKITQVYGKTEIIKGPNVPCKSGNYTYSINPPSSIKVIKWECSSGLILNKNNGNTIILTIPSNFKRTYGWIKANLTGGISVLKNLQTLAQPVVIEASVCKGSAYDWMGNYKQVERLHIVLKNIQPSPQIRVDLGGNSNTYTLPGTDVYLDYDVGTFNGSTQVDIQVVQGLDDCGDDVSTYFYPPHKTFYPVVSGNCGF